VATLIIPVLCASLKDPTFAVDGTVAVIVAAAADSIAASVIIPSTI
jgi:hypothetical protein